MAETLEIALFAEGETGLRLVGRLGDPDLVAAVRVRLAAERRRELARLESPVRPVPDEDQDDAPPACHPPRHEGVDP